MKQETLVTIVRRGLDEVWSGRNSPAIDEVYDADYIFHEASRPDVKGLAQFKQLVAMYQTIFANLRFTAMDRVVGEDRVVTRWEASSTHAAPFAGVPATGKPILVTGISIDRIKEGKIVETWTNWDPLGVLQQIGAIPEMAA